MTGVSPYIGQAPSSTVHPPKRSLQSRAVSGIATAIVGVLTLIDMVISPIVRPLSVYIGHSSPVDFIRNRCRRLPAYLALFALGVPLAVAEPAKIFALWLIGEGHYISGLVTLAVAYLVSLVLIDSIYEGARPQLRSIGWFAVMVDRISAVRISVMTTVRASRVWRAAQRIKLAVRARLRRPARNASS